MNAAAGTPIRNHSIKCRWIERIRSIDRSLERAYRTPDLGNLPDSTDELFYILLSNRSDPARYPGVFRELKRELGIWDNLRKRSVSDVELILQPLGFAQQRADLFRRIAELLAQEFGRVTLEPLHDWTSDKRISFLRSLPGVGEKSARCVVTYTLGGDYFAIDVHILRIVRRIGLVPVDWTVEKAHRRFDLWLPSGIAERLHVNMVAHGRAICRGARPACERCPIFEICHRRGLPRKNQLNP